MAAKYCKKTPKEMPPKKKKHLKTIKNFLIHGIPEEQEESTDSIVMLLMNIWKKG